METTNLIINAETKKPRINRGLITIINKQQIKQEQGLHNFIELKKLYHSKTKNKKQTTFELKKGI